MVIDCHVHLSATTPGRGVMSEKLLRSPQFKFLRWKFGLDPAGEAFDSGIERTLVEQINEAVELDAAVVLAFDAVYATDGQRDDRQTHLYISNDAVADLASRNPKVLFGASVHPYRKDAIQELERCIALGAVLVKWLPITQGIDPSDRRCFAFYEALAHHGIPLLSHTGGEAMLPNVNSCADPALLMPALRRGVTVIAAHCGTPAFNGRQNYFDSWCRLALEHEHLYGDTAALNLPRRSAAYRRLLADSRLRAKVVHGSDWPVMPIPPLTQLGPAATIHLMEQRNWLRRDVQIKRRLGFDDAYFNRGATLLRLPPNRRPGVGISPPPVV